ncbi:MAG: hypothetical protein ACKPKO_57045, partial [Candidatus Fonsibacter sp.]
EDGNKVCASEDWAPLSLVLRRAQLPNSRITLALLREWKAKVTPSTSVISVSYLVEAASLDALPQYPPDGSSPRMSWWPRLTFIMTEP